MGARARDFDKLNEYGMAQVPMPHNQWLKLTRRVNAPHNLAWRYMLKELR